MDGWGQLRPPLALAGAFFLGSIPVSNLLAYRLRRTDLRTIATGTVSVTNLYRVAGFGPLVAGGLLDFSKGATGPLLVGREQLGWAAVAGGLAVVGHNWSPFLRGAGGRGLLSAMGALAVLAPEGAVLLLGGLIVGRFVGHTALGALAAQLLLVPVLAAIGGFRHAFAGVCVLVPMLLKRLLGNGPPDPAAGRAVWRTRLLYDRDVR